MQALESDEQWTVIRNIPYSSNPSVLQSLDMIRRKQNSDLSNGQTRVWIVYIHGGAWRDPEITSRSFDVSVKALQKQDKHMTHVEGIVSVNYRLSPYHYHARNPSHAADQSRNVVHPAHVQDVATAIQFLSETAPQFHKYILCGHSCGATLAWQLVLGIGNHLEKVMKPIGIVGIAGIYDIPALQERHKDPVYRVIVKGAFGNDRAAQEAASPTLWLRDETNQLKEVWADGQVIIVGRSTQDALVENEQAEEFWEALKQDRHRIPARQDEFLWLMGAHDDLWRTDILASCITRALVLLFGE